MEQEHVGKCGREDLNAACVCVYVTRYNIPYLELRACINPTQCRTDLADCIMLGGRCVWFVKVRYLGGG